MKFARSSFMLFFFFCLLKFIWFNGLHCTNGVVVVYDVWAGWYFDFSLCLIPIKWQIILKSHTHIIYRQQLVFGRKWANANLSICRKLLTKAINTESVRRIVCNEYRFTRWSWFFHWCLFIEAKFIGDLDRLHQQHIFTTWCFCLACKTWFCFWCSIDDTHTHTMSK